MPDTYSTDTLLGVVDGLKVAVPALLGRYFGSIVIDDSEEIHFDVISKTRRLAPFVHPKVAGKIVKNEGFTTKTFKPAYVKDKREFDPSKALKRAPGEPIGGNMSAQERRDLALANSLTDQQDMLNRRLEVMAVEALRLGQVTVTGDEYPTVVVDFGRDATLAPAALAGTDVWDNAASAPLTDLRTLMLLTLQKSGVAARDVIMGWSALAAFLDHASVKGRLDTRNITGNTAATIATFEEGLTFIGVVDGFNIWTYAGWYVDDTGTEVEIFPAKEVVMASPGVQGVQAFGAIKDASALFAVRSFSKMWIDDDPGVEWLLTQSAPLVVPTRVNATAKQQVLA